MSILALYLTFVSGYHNNHVYQARSAEDNLDARSSHPRHADPASEDLLDLWERDLEIRDPYELNDDGHDLSVLARSLADLYIRDADFSLEDRDFYEFQRKARAYQSILEGRAGSRSPSPKSQSPKLQSPKPLSPKTPPPGPVASDPSKPWVLYVAVYGPGTDPTERSHWGFMISRKGASEGKLLHVVLPNKERLLYVFQEREKRHVIDGSEELWKIAELSDTERVKAMNILRGNPPPVDGKRKCQDWVLEGFIRLVADELVAEVQAHQCMALMGKSAEELRTILGPAWTPTVKP